MQLMRRSTMLLAALGVGAAAAPARARTCCPIVELRQYTLKPGRRDELIALFEENFVESQEALGMSLIGQFRDIDDPNRFVWLRGFENMATRATALQAFYSGAIWKAHSKAANETMIDTDNVLLLHPATARSSFSLGDARASFATGNGSGMVAATIYAFEGPVGDDFIRFFEREIAPVFEADGVSIKAMFVSEHSPNTFPALPVRENENVFIWFATFASFAAYRAHADNLARSVRAQKLAPRLRDYLKAEPQTLRLTPTVRSLLHG